MERSRLLFGQFRKGDANDPETYTASIAVVLAQYPDDVIRQATDPRTGLGGRLDWLPTVKEVRDFCTEIVEAEAAAARRERDLQHQVAGRAAYEKVRKAAPTREVLRAKGLLREKPIDPVSADILWSRYQKARELYGASVALTDDSRRILVSAGYRP